MATWDTIPVAEYTEAKVDGKGVFDVLMKATASQLESEFNKNRIRGPEYATVYLGAIESVQRTALEFLVQSNKLALEAQTMEVRLKIAETELAQAAVALEIAKLQLQKVPAEIALLEAQAIQVGQQTKNLQAEELNIPKQGLRIDAETALSKQQATNLTATKLQIEAQTALVTQQKLNAVTEETVLKSQKCKLDAEYDVLVGTKLKVVVETSLLNQKVATERAQTVAAGIDPGSVVGKQITLYTAQADGFARDAEQKAAKLMTDTWNVRRTTDEGTDANTVNKLDDAAIGRAVTKMLTGVGA